MRLSNFYNAAITYYINTQEAPSSYFLYIRFPLIKCPIERTETLFISTLIQHYYAYQAAFNEKPCCVSLASSKNPFSWLQYHQRSDASRIIRNAVAVGG